MVHPAAKTEFWLDLPRIIDRSPYTRTNLRQFDGRKSQTNQRTQKQLNGLIRVDCGGSPRRFALLNLESTEKDARFQRLQKIT